MYENVEIRMNESINGGGERGIKNFNQYIT
jgi:hypothetical protein